MCTSSSSSSSSSSCYSSSSFSSVSVSLQQHVSKCVSQVHHESYSVSNICATMEWNSFPAPKMRTKKFEVLGQSPSVRSTRLRAAPEPTMWHVTTRSWVWWKADSAGGAGWWLCCNWSIESEIFLKGTPISTFAIHCGPIFLTVPYIYVWVFIHTSICNRSGIYIIYCS